MLHASPQPRLALATMMNAKPGDATVLLAMVCSSFSAANRGTSQRSIVCPLGDITKRSVQIGNMMLCRIAGPKIREDACHARSSE